MIETVKFRSNWTAVVLTACVICALVFGYAAFDQSLLLSLSENRRGGWLTLLLVFEYGDVNWAVLAMVAWLIFESRKPFRQWRNPVALSLSDGALAFHPSLRQGTVPIERAANISYEAGLVKSDIKIELITGEKIRIRNVDDCDAQEAVKWAEAGKGSA